MVHDENAAALDGVAGNAGIFSTTGDLLALGRGILAGLRGTNPLPVSGALLREMVTPQPAPGADAGIGLGFRIDDPSFMSGLLGSGRAYGHTGFTGTSLVIDEARDLVLVLLTNRVHPDRSWADLGPLRRRLADEAAATWSIRRPDRTAGCR